MPPQKQLKWGRVYFCLTVCWGHSHHNGEITEVKTVTAVTSIIFTVKKQIVICLFSLFIWFRIQAQELAPPKVVSSPTLINLIKIINPPETCPEPCLPGDSMFCQLDGINHHILHHYLESLGQRFWL